MPLKSRRLQDIIFTSHALERARQRIKIEDCDNQNIIYEFKLKELVKKCECVEDNEGKLIFELIYSNKKFKVVGVIKNDKILIITVIG